MITFLYLIRVTILLGTAFRFVISDEIRRTPAYATVQPCRVSDVVWHVSLAGTSG